MEHFIYKDISSDSLDLIIKEMPLVPQAERNIESISLNGRNGNLHIDNKNYKSKNYSIICYAKDLSKIDDICAFLQGSGKLVLSKYPNRYFNATIMNQISFKKYSNYLQEFPIQFELDPIAYSNEETIEELNESGSITIEGNTEIKPVVTITGTGAITINGYSLVVQETGITIDCELMNCTKNNLSKNDKVILDEFPVLNVGTNEIVLGTGITNIDIKYRKGWL